ncbi:MAG: hypothetical protein JSV56_11125 [Methanomassiliicoccales archaeon]|nr:MAG: hypothetical protein JSV56_11125 [Methanomassiliicoccales archaeon]
MEFEKLYNEILPYISDPKALKKFLDKHKNKGREELIEEINRIIPESTTSFQTDLRILQNALSKRS